MTAPSTTDDVPATARRAESAARRGEVTLRALLAGLCLVAAVPPWGWWPLAIVGVALLDGLLADQPAFTRFRRTWVVAATWLYPGMVWMWDLTPPGYLVAGAAYAAYFGVAAALTPPGAGRRVALPGAVALAEVARWAWPFGGVPLATIPMGQAAGPLAEVVRLAGPVLLVVVVVVAGQALAAAVGRQWRPAGVGTAVVAAAVLVAGLAPRGEAVGELDVALVQGGGPQRTRAADTDEREVFERHLAASQQVATPVDLVVWPENVVNVTEFATSREREELAELARRLDTTLVVGIVEDAGPGRFENAAVAFAPDGTVVDRYDKVRIVPFGEYVPLRGLLERVAGDTLPGKDAVRGDGRATLDTPVGRLGVAISWEIFFAGRAREGIADGGEVLLNPTNGSSYWLTIVQGQQVASSRLRALETGRWVLQTAPTGFTALVTPDGEVVDRSAVSEARVIHGTIERRRGDTWATRLGDRPAIALSALLVAAGWALDRRSRRADAAADELSPGPASG